MSYLCFLLPRLSHSRTPSPSFTHYFGVIQPLSLSHTQLPLWQHYLSPSSFGSFALLSTLLGRQIMSSSIYTVPCFLWEFIYFIHIIYHIQTFELLESEFHNPQGFWGNWTFSPLECCLFPTRSGLCTPFRWVLSLFFYPWYRLTLPT